MKPIDGHAMIQRVEALHKRGAVDLSYYNIVKEAVQMEPAVDAVPVEHAVWKEKRHAYNDEEAPIEEWQSAKCSKCGKYHTTPYLYYFTDYAYCPNCGAKMNGKRRDEGETGND